MVFLEALNLCTPENPRLANELTGAVASSTIYAHTTVPLHHGQTHTYRHKHSDTPKSTTCLLLFLGHFYAFIYLFINFRLCNCSESPHLNFISFNSLQAVRWWMMKAKFLCVNFLFLVYVCVCVCGLCVCVVVGGGGVILFPMVLKIHTHKKKTRLSCATS